MSPIGRIFSVLNLILAALFLSWAAFTLAEGESAKDELAVAKASFEKTIQDKEDNIASLTADRDQARSALASAANQVETLETNVARQQGEIEDERNNNNQLRTSVDRMTTTQGSQQDSLAALESAKSDAVEGRHTAETASADALRAQEAAESEVAGLQAEIARLEKVVGDRDVSITSLGKQLDRKKVELASLAEYTNTSLSEITVMRLIEGSVIAVNYDVAPGLVSINRGSVDGVTRGYTFEVFNGNDYKGRVRVENVRENSCTALVTIPATDSAGRAVVIGQGDSASTKI